MCNDARAMHPAVEYFGTSADWIWSMLGHPCINQLPASLAPTGDHPGCVSEDGAYDMVGNLHEWTADPDGTFRPDGVFGCGLALVHDTLFLTF